MPSGTVVWLQRTPFRGAECVPLDAGVLREDWGLEGDRHARPASSRQIVLVRAEVLDDLGLPHGATREQLTVAGLGELGTGDRLRIGDAVVEVQRARVPCRVMEGVRRGLEAELAGRGGWCGRVLATGTVRRGDEVSHQPVSDPAAAPGGDHPGDPRWLRDYLEAITGWEASPVAPAGTDGWSFRQRLAHLIGWDEHAVAEIACAVAAGVSPLPAGTVAVRHRLDERNAAAVARLTESGTTPDLWALHDLRSTAVVDAARRNPAHAEAWVRALTAHYQEHR